MSALPEKRTRTLLLTFGKKMWLTKLVFTDENVAADGVKLMTATENRLQRKGDNF